MKCHFDLSNLNCTNLLRLQLQHTREKLQFSEHGDSELKVEPIGKASLIGKPVPFKDGNANATYRAQILTNDSVVRNAFVKDLNINELCIELLSASVGKLLGLPIPNSYLVLSKQSLPSSVGPQLSTGERLLFGSEDAQTPSLTKWINSTPSDFRKVLRRVANWKGVDSLFSFDTWIANVDRNIGNLLFGANGIWLIDHGQAFGGPLIALSDLRPEKPYPQKLTIDLGKVMTDSQKDSVATKCKAFPNDSALVDSKLLLANNLIESIWGKSEFDMAVNFLEARRTHVPKLGSALVGQEVLL